LKKNILFLLFILFSVSVYPKSGQALLKLKIFPETYRIFIAGNEVFPARDEEKTKKIILEKGSFKIKITAKGYQDKEFDFTLSKNTLLEEKLEKNENFMTLLSEVKTGRQPKSVRFTPDGKYILAPLLDDNGMDIISVETGKVFKRIVFPKELALKKGFVETAVSVRNNEIWLAQMHAELVHVISLDTFEVKKSIPTQGIYSKVILFSKDESTAFISNWDSRDITVIDALNYKVIRKIPVYGIPRGMVMSPDGKYLYAALFNKPKVIKIDLKTNKIVLSIPCGNAMRHLVPDYSKGVFFASSMGNGKIYIISFENDKILKEKLVDDKLNTIDLSPDGKTLFVSSRGPNNKKTYLMKGPEFGKVFVLDAQTLEITSWLWGRNQPTGLAVSPDGSLLAFSDFLDKNIEIYRINGTKP